MISGIRTPQRDEPYSFEAKDFTRKHTIGKKVKIESEFSKENQRGEKLNFCSITVIQND